MNLFGTTVDVMPLLMVVITSLGIPLATFFAKLAVGEAAALLGPYIGEANARSLQARANELLEKGIGEAALHYLPELQAKGLTVDLGNAMAARVADYAVSHAPDLAGKIAEFEGALEEKVKARLITHSAVQAAIASGPASAPMDVRPAAQLAAAA